MVKKLNLNAIRIDGGTQPRERINMETVAEYAEAIKAGESLPAVVVVHDGSDYWLADGFHRYHANQQAGKASIDAEVMNGTVLDAKLFAVGANGSHGLRRTNEDKRRAVQMVLDEPAWKDWSDRKIADACGVSIPFVSAIRRPAVAAKQQESRAKQYPTKAEGCNPITPQPVPSAAPKNLAPWDKTPEPTLQPALDDAREAVHILSEENDRLNDRLAVEAMDATEEEKTKAADTIASLRAELRTANAELSAVRTMRDILLKENAELKRSVASLQRKLKKEQAGATA